MNLAALAALLGTTVNIRVESGAFVIPVVISDAKSSYGNTRYLVTPVGGTGTVWVDASRVVA